MLFNTRGIFLKKIKYGDTAFIIKIYTEEFGLKSYIVRGISSKKNKKLAFFQSLSLLNLIVYNKPGKDLQSLKEVQNAYSFSQIPFDIRKASILIFLNEVIFHTIKEEEKNKELFQFLFDSIVKLDSEKVSTSLFHLVFLIQLSKYLGVGPQNNFNSNNQYFNLNDACFKSNEVEDTYMISKVLSQHFNQLLIKASNPEFEININSADRGKLLEWILKYYQIHVHGFPEVKSLSVLKSVFD